MIFYIFLTCSPHILIHSIPFTQGPITTKCKRPFDYYMSSFISGGDLIGDQAYVNDFSCLDIEWYLYFTPYTLERFWELSFVRCWVLSHMNHWFTCHHWNMNNCIIEPRDHVFFLKVIIIISLLRVNFWHIYYCSISLVACKY